jgi:NAD-dependent dihydropyrimidine dehydrogenase PreA subunit
MSTHLSSLLTGLLTTGHIFTEHVGFQPTTPHLRKVGPLQYGLHWIYAVLEPHILRAFDRLLKFRWVTDTRAGLLMLNLLCKMGFFFPHCICVSTEAAERFVDHIFETEGPKGARLAVGPCVCQKALGLRVEPYMKDMVLLYGADIYYHLNLGYRIIDAKEAKQILRQCQEAGLVHFLDLCMRSGKYVFVICNCDQEICPGNRIYPLTGKFLWPGPEIVTHDPSACLGVDKCGNCFKQCYYHVNRATEAGKVELDLDKCMGCGLCLRKCLGNARSLIPRNDYAHEHQVPASLLLGK